MSALQLPPTGPALQRAAAAPAAPAAPTDGPHLRVVPTPARDPLAPTSRLQAWRRRTGVALILSALLVLGAQALAGGDAVTPVPVSQQTAVVQPGESLWDVARANAPAGTSTADYVEQLRSTNALDGAVVQPWQVLRLPAA